MLKGKLKSPCDDCPYKKGIIVAVKNPCTNCKKKEEWTFEHPLPWPKKPRPGDKTPKNHKS